MALAITNKESLKQIFDKVHKVYYFDTPDKPLAEQEKALELPVLEDGVSFDTGAPDISEVKLTDETTWVSKSKQGDSDISFQVSSVHATINDLLMEKKTATPVSADFGGYSYTGDGYSLYPKKVTGALFMQSEDKSTAIYLPNVEMFASFNGEGGDDSTGYYNVAVTPLTDSQGAAFYPLVGTPKTESSTGGE